MMRYKRMQVHYIFLIVKTTNIHFKKLRLLYEIGKCLSNTLLQIRLPI